MKNMLCAGAVALLLAVPTGVALAQDHDMQHDMGPIPRAREGKAPMPMQGGAMGPMGGMMQHRGMEEMMQLMKDNPKLAGMMMQMHGEMMRIRGEAMSKTGEVMMKYGKMMEKEGAR